jgi:hypothetical protein
MMQIFSHSLPHPTTNGMQAIEAPDPRPKVIDCPLKAPADTFNLEDTSEGERVPLTELYNNDQFRSTKSFRGQVFLAAESMHSESYRIPYSQIGIMFGISKGAVT